MSHLTDNQHVRRHKALAGYILIELEDVPWDFWRRDAGDRIIFCGELGHAEWVLYQIAWKYSVELLFREALLKFTHRVEDELHSTRNEEPDTGE
jgi:hypothetical protein